MSSDPFHIGIVTPADAGSRAGNRVSALRYYKILKRLRYRVDVRVDYQDQPWDALIALHARRSSEAVRRYRELFPERPIVLVLTGTDIYENLPANDVETLRSIELATELVTLQPLAIEQLPAAHRARSRTILQSVGPLPFHHPDQAEPSLKDFDGDSSFPVCVIGHLRDVKDPLRTALAARELPEASRIRVWHVGAATAPELADAARDEEQANARYRWLGECDRRATLRLISRCRLLCHTSILEGGANVISESVVAATPVLASRIPGSVGLLGHEYPGYFPVGDTAALTTLLERAEADPTFYAALKAATLARRPRFAPELEIEAWRRLLRPLLTEPPRNPQPHC